MSGSTGSPSWAEAVAELESILAELESDDVDVDVLSVRVRRAAELIAVCRDRIAGARFEVERVVAELAGSDDDGEPTDGSDGGGVHDEGSDDQGADGDVG